MPVQLDAQALFDVLDAEFLAGLQVLVTPSTLEAEETVRNVFNNVQSHWLAEGL